MNKLLPILLGAALASSGCNTSFSPESEALLKCQKIIKVAARNPSSAEIPYTKAVPVVDGFQFTWSHGSGLRLQNGFGALVDSSASCTVLRGRVEALTVNGQTYN